MRYVTLMMLFLTLSVLSADEAVLMDEDFTQLPDLWVNEGWTFHDYGARSLIGVSQGYEEELFGTLDAPQGCLFIPDGTDSLVILVDHQLEMSVTSMLDASASATITVWESSSGWTDCIYSAVESSGWFEDGGIIEHVMRDPEQGGLIGFRFMSIVGAAGMVEYGQLDWHIYSMTVTAYGSSLPLVGTTWGDIKSIF